MRARKTRGKISNRYNRHLHVLFAQAASVVLIKPQSWERHGRKRRIGAAKKRLPRHFAFPMRGDISRRARPPITERAG